MFHPTHKKPLYFKQAIKKPAKLAGFFIFAFLFIAGACFMFPNSVLAKNPTYTSYDFLNIGEFGIVNNADENWLEIKFIREYKSAPVVISKSISGNGPDACAVSIADVTQNSFKISIQEWGYLDNQHVNETITYFVIPQGVHHINEEMILEAGFADNLTDVQSQVSFQNSFPETPIVITQLQTKNNNQTLITRNKSISTDNFSINIQAQASSALPIEPETAGYLAVTPFSGAIEQDGYLVKLEARSVNADAVAATVSFGQTFNLAPALIIDTQTVNDNTPNTPRTKNTTSLSFDVYLQNDGSLEQTPHQQEQVGYLAIEPYAYDFFDIGEFAAINNLTHKWQTIKFKNSYEQPPVVIAKPLSYNGEHPAHIRLRNITNESFDIKVEEWMYLDKTHMSEKASYIAVKQGVYNINEGKLLIEAGKVEDVTNQKKQVTFQREDFTHTPLLFTQSQTFHGTDPIVTRNSSLTQQGFTVQAQEEEARGNHPCTEEVGYIALSSYFGVLTNQDCILRVNASYTQTDEKTLKLVFPYKFNTVPSLFIDLRSKRGADTVNPRCRELTPDYFRVFMQEEKSKDDETDHYYEYISYFSIEKLYAPQPQSPIVSINNNASYTNQDTVNLKITKRDDDITFMQVSEDGVNYTQDLPFSEDYTLTYQNTREGYRVAFVKLKNANGYYSPGGYDLITMDKTPPSEFTAEDEGDLAAKQDTLELAYTESTDARSGIQCYKYAVGTQANETDILSWTDNGLNTAATITGLNLTHTNSYYISVRAYDNAGNFTQTCTDGITYDAPPQIADIILTATGNAYHQGSPITIWVVAADADGDAMEYQYSAADNIVQDWTTSSQASWTPTTGYFGQKAIKVEVRTQTEPGNSHQKQVYIFRAPVDAE